MKKIWYRFKAHMALEKISELERRRSFINEFFCGKTAYPIKLAKWEKSIKKARQDYEKYKKYL